MDLTQIITALLGIVFTAVVIPLTKAAFEWLKGKTRSEALRSALGEAQTVADNVIASLQANVVEGLKARSADGKLSARDAKEVSERAVKMFLSDLSAGSLKVISENADDITGYVKNLIEARLLAAKKGRIDG